ncbi:SDR family NAD(P)-dependent oxidoreductase [Aequorivita marina]|uniref:SDR family NAD(P)-dependent oxidoreductase n=1 Tax=Aequorivita marina TaxID=3073654 RepID=UPI002873F957|nr:SDR family oxidoreductase [Aequorivita sp. S2608]MDS1299406.1 SDR family oxidoreductase [Aequorivita sp. S2608]
MKDFKNKVVVITGGATGIGKAMADKFGAEGATVILTARRENRLQEAVQDLKEKGVKARYKVCDVSKLEDVKALADYAWKEFGHVDVLVSNAGIPGSPGSIVDLSENDFKQVYDVNVFGLLNCVWAFGKRMVEQKTPAMILVVNSETGLYTVGPYMSTYMSSKFASKAIALSLRQEMPEQIQVGCIFPGLVQSELGGSKAMTQAGMTGDEFIDIIWPQIENGDFYIVSHPWGKDYCKEEAEEITKAFEKYAPHFEGDQKYDSRWLASQM